MPHERAIECFFTQKIREVFVGHAFNEIETRVVEPVSALLAKGETSKEVYLLTRLQDAYEGDGKIDLREQLNSSKQLGLHFDLTVPFARYVMQNSGNLQFPFRRFSIGKVWRGERAQAGRFREFVQADVDIIAASESGVNALPTFNDVEIVHTIGTALSNLKEFGLPQSSIHLNSRKLLQGCYEYIGINDYASVLQIVDKLPKIGKDKVSELLSEIGVDNTKIDKCLEIAMICTDNVEELTDNDIISNAIESNELAREGINEILYCVRSLHKKRANNYDLVVDLSITRGLDYYTGLVFETFLQGYENYGSVASGGRYDNLTSTLNENTKINYPGVGMSIGVTRLLSIALSNNLISEELTQKARQTADIMVIVNSEDEREYTESVTEEVRSLGFSAYTCPNSAKFGKQIDFAAKRHIPYVLFVAEDGKFNLKNIITGDQNILSNINEINGFIK